jgi:hypothetical protein
MLPGHVARSQVHRGVAIRKGGLLFMGSFRALGGHRDDRQRRQSYVAGVYSAPSVGRRRSRLSFNVAVVTIVFNDHPCHHSSLPRGHGFSLTPVLELHAVDDPVAS